jgi:xanthine dehydrogenase accessory factor
LKPADFARAVKDLVDRGEAFAIATVVRVEGSSLGRPGFKAIISSDGKVILGTLGGVCPESAIVTMALKAIRTGEPRLVRVHLESVEGAVRGMVKSQGEDEVYVETFCGGTMEIFVEPVLPPERLILIGQGGRDPVEDALIALGKMLDFEVVVIDPHPILSNQPDLLISERDFDIAKFGFRESDSVVVLTKGARDIPVLEALSHVRVRFVGLLASRRRVLEDLRALAKAGVSRDFLASIHAPVGVDIGAVTPEEIAVSILADILATRRGRHLPHKELPLAEAAPPMTSGGG